MNPLLKNINFKSLIHPERWPVGALRLPRIQAHRGYWLGGEQENTLAAFRAAREKNALMIECDVRLTKDKVPVIFHDEDLLRLGKEKTLVKDLTAKELSAKIHAPTLFEVLKARDIPQLINIELKSKVIVDDPLERKVAEIVRAAKAESRVLFSSFNPFSLWRISQYLPDIPRALLVTPDPHPENHVLLRKMMLAPLIRLHLLHLDQRMATAEEMTFWKKKKMPIAVWTVNDKDAIETHLKNGAISVITDTL